MIKNDLPKNILDMKWHLENQMFDQCKEVSYILILVGVAKLQYLETYIKYNFGK